MAENKTTIVEHLTTALQATSEFRDLLFLEYRKEGESGGEEVVAHFANGTEKRTNVNMDSGSALIQDVINQLRK